MSKQIIDLGEAARMSAVPEALDDQEFLSRVRARMTQAGYSEQVAMRVVRVDMQARAVEAERAAVVKYLRDEQAKRDPMLQTHWTIAAMGDAIEKGEHL